jgi:hypothetical protein
MSTYDSDLLAVSRRLLARSSGQRGKLPGASIRRSLSTTYYALFHFLVDEAGLRLIGAHNDLRRRRRVLARNFTHAGMRTALEKVRGPQLDISVEDFLRWPGAPEGRLPSPTFAQSLAKAFLDAQTKRHDADYDLNKLLTATDARLTRTRVKDVIREWRSSNSFEDRDFKNGLCMLMLLKGQLRRET